MKLDIDKFNLFLAKQCFTINDLAEKSKVTRQALYNYIAEKRKPKPAIIGRIAKALQVEVEDIIQKRGQER